MATIADIIMIQSRVNSRTLHPERGHFACFRGTIRIIACHNRIPIPGIIALGIVRLVLVGVMAGGALHLVFVQLDRR